MEIAIIGGGWVTAKNYGRMREGGRPVLATGAPAFPATEEIYTVRPARYRRFDPFTRLGLAAIALALQDAGLAAAGRKRSAGIVVSSVYECFEVDLAYYETAAKAGGQFASPNLFSYTLPGIVTGEAAIYFGLTGPTFTVGDSIASRGYPALAVAVDMIRAESCRTVVSGWLDSPGDRLQAHVRNIDPVCGAVFLVLSSKYQNSALKRIRTDGAGRLSLGGKKIASIFDLFE